MRYRAPPLIGLLILAALLAGASQPSFGAPEWAAASPPLTDSDGDGLPDPIDPGDPQPGEDQCPSLAEDPDGVDGQDGCPDSDVSVSVTKDEAYTVTVSTMETKTVDIWIQNGNYPADILAHVLSVSTVGACEVSLIAAPGDGVFPLTTDEDGDTTAETFFYLLEWELSLDAGESYHTTRDYEVSCYMPGEHTFEIQVDVVPWPPVEEEDVEDLPNVHKNFPVVTVVSDAGPDSDGDGFSDGVENFVGTLPLVACAATPAADDEDPDAWPADFDDNQVVDILDIVQLTPPAFNSEGDPNGDGYFTDADPDYSRRKDLASFTGEPDGVIDLWDILELMPPVFNTSCTP